MLKATVFVWYPHRRDVGHCSMYIGDHRLDNNQLMHSRQSVRNKHIKSEEKAAAEAFKNPDRIIWPETTNYVSWWPSNSQTIMHLVTKSPRGQNMHSLHVDCEAEKRAPDTVFHIEDHLNTEAMLNAWSSFKKVNNIYRGVRLCSTEYNLWTRNCSMAVWHVLKAGGIKQMTQEPIRAGRYVTPKTVASILTKLKNSGSTVIKEKSETCPSKAKSIMATLFGFR